MICCQLITSKLNHERFTGTLCKIGVINVKHDHVTIHHTQDIYLYIRILTTKRHRDVNITDGYDACPLLLPFPVFLPVVSIIKTIII